MLTYKDYCKDKNKTESFYGVGYQHRNAQEERLFHNVMYYVQNFIVHSVLIGIKTFICFLLMTSAVFGFITFWKIEYRHFLHLGL